MTNTALLIGNDINNINKGTSWNDLLISIKNKYHVQTLENGRKPFPMLYEEIFLSAIQQLDIMVILTPLLDILTPLFRISSVQLMT
ncbi:hypothetical protein ACR780_15755 [Sphingobacterium faecium]|uniref:hypothetical protein n=1 Tax=Sphingobacterium faecium TaxID=34087 RepID=UPI003DA4EBD7